MRRKRAIPRAAAAKRGSAILGRMPRSGRDPGQFSTGKDPLLRRKYQELTRKHISGLPDQLFAEFTGLHFHIAWAPPIGHDWDARTLPSGCSAYCRLAGQCFEAQPICQACGLRQLVRTLSTDGEGLCFTCRWGVLNHWLPIRVRSMIVGIAYLQALDGAQTRRSPRQKSPRAAARMMSRSEFRRASRLLRLIVQHVQILDLADLRKADLTHARQAVLALEREQVQLRAAFKCHLPPPLKIIPNSTPDSHPDRIVRALLECLEQHYAQPITLKQCAGKLRLNVAYLSDLFSRAVGQPFKTYLTALRMEKAQALLSDPAKTVTDVAYEVGYASENRFRIAFKKATRLSPRIWRETIQTNPPDCSV